VIKKEIFIASELSMDARNRQNEKYGGSSERENKKP